MFEWYVSLKFAPCYTRHLRTDRSTSSGWVAFLRDPSSLSFGMKAQWPKIETNAWSGITTPYRTVHYCTISVSVSGICIQGSLSYQSPLFTGLGFDYLLCEQVQNTRIYTHALALVQTPKAAGGVDICMYAFSIGGYFD
jgi:hypothetical protein